MEGVESEKKRLAKYIENEKRYSDAKRASLVGPSYEQRELMTEWRRLKYEVVEELNAFDGTRIANKCVFSTINRHLWLKKGR